MKFKSIFFTIAMFAIGALNAQEPLNWFIDSPDPGDLSLAPNSEFYTQGDKSCEMTLHTSNVPYLKSDNYNVNGNVSYTFSIDVLDNDTRGQLKIYADFYDSDGNDVYGESPVYSEDSPDWQTITWDALVPETAVEGYVWIKFYDQDDFVDMAVVFVDNAIFIENGGDNIVENGSFEQWNILEMSNAYCTSETTIDVRYNGDVESANAADFTLNGSSNITFSGAVVDTEEATLVHLSGASSPMLFDLTIDQLTLASKNQSLDLYAGICPISYTNTLNPDATIENDISATFTGIISANDSYNNMWISEAAGEYNGVMVFSYNMVNEVTRGDEIIFTATRDDYYNLTELMDPILIEIVSSGNTPYEASNILGSDISDVLPASSPSAEKWEGQLVSINNALVTEFNEDDHYYICTTDDGVTQFRISDNVNYQLSDITLSVGDYYKVTGIIDFTYEQYAINPRDADDVIITTNIQNENVKSFEIFPNPATNKIALRLNYDITALQIYNLTGIMVYEVNNISLKDIVISIEDLPAGSYFIKTIDSKKSETISKFIKK
ncbi:MAG: hypothetical protein B7C24_01165 [Bacteroidetes bacterium 4572_77]|nr:MAG: hypothetical protein B7C24_01165 [Bacteroidetes bacterium 4572_77]